MVFVPVGPLSTPTPEAQCIAVNTWSLLVLGVLLPLCALGCMEQRCRRLFDAPAWRGAHGAAAAPAGQARDGPRRAGSEAQQEEEAAAADPPAGGTAETAKRFALSCCQAWALVSAALLLWQGF